MDEISNENSNDSTAKALYEHGVRVFESGNADDALTAFDEALKVCSAFASAYNGRAAVLLSQGKVEQAIADIEEAIRLDPQLAKAYVNRGVVSHRRGQREQALADYNEAIRLDPQLTAAYIWRAQYFLDVEEYANAIDDLSHCLGDNPKINAWVFGQRGSAHHHLQQIGEALADYDEAIRLDPANWCVFHCRGSAYLADDDCELAIDDFDDAIRLNPDAADVYCYRGNAYYQLGDHERAIADYTNAIQLDATQFDPHFYRAQAWHDLDELEKAVEDLTNAIRINPHPRKALIRRAEIWRELGDDELAEQDFERAQILTSGEELENETMFNRNRTIYALLEKHFAPTPLDEITITERRFPVRVRADLQRAIDRLLQNDATLLHFCGVRKQYNHEGINFSELLIKDRDAALSVPPQYEEIDIGEQEPVKCLKDGLWLLEESEQKLAVFLEPPSHFGRREGIRFQVATVNNPEGTTLSQKFFKRFENAVLESECYRGKILSLEVHDHYSGTSTGITVHKLRTVGRDQVILPSQTLDLLERNVIQFVKQRPRLAKFGLATKKGLLFYGPPGTGKTHTIHFLAGALDGHTTLLISAEQVGLLSEYMTLARLLQPSMVVIEDVDLIARDRSQMESVCEEVLLNKLLNEMDGLRSDADILFVLTTNRPEALEAALASRPGRVDQAIEFPLPDAEGRSKLILLYSGSMDVPSEVVQGIVKRTESVSAAFIKELMRRAMQFHLEQNDSPTLAMNDVENALEELLFKGGSLNRKLLGAGVAES